MVPVWTKRNSFCERRDVWGSRYRFGGGCSRSSSRGWLVCLCFQRTVESPGGQQYLRGSSVTTHPVSLLEHSPSFPLPLLNSNILLCEFPDIKPVTTELGWKKQKKPTKKNLSLPSSCDLSLKIFHSPSCCAAPPKAPSSAERKEERKRERKKVKKKKKKVTAPTGLSLTPAPTWARRARSVSCSCGAAKSRHNPITQLLELSRSRPWNRWVWLFFFFFSLLPPNLAAWLRFG